MTHTLTPLHQGIVEAYGKNTCTIHASQIPLGIMKYSMRYCARVIGILGDGNYILIQDMITHKRAIAYIRPDRSIENTLFGLHREPAWEK